MNGVRGEGANGITKAIYHFLQSCKHFISEPALAEFLPDLFDWIHFRRIWRNKKQTYVFRNTERARLMPSSPIAAKEDHIVRILICQLGQEEIHTRRIAVWHNKKTGFPGKWLYCAIHATILSDVMAGNRRPNSFLAPTIFRLVDPPEACLILKHQPHITSCGKL